MSESSSVLDTNEDGQRLATAADGGHPSVVSISPLCLPSLFSAAIASGSTMSSSATYSKPGPDLPQYRVDRHTPRANRAQRRSWTCPATQSRPVQLISSTSP